MADKRDDVFLVSPRFPHAALVSFHVSSRHCLPKSCLAAAETPRPHAPRPELYDRTPPSTKTRYARPWTPAESTDPILPTCPPTRTSTDYHSTYCCCLLCSYATYIALW